MTDVEIKITDPEHIPEEDIDKSLRPTRLSEFIGQAQARGNLQLFIDAALKRRDVLDHVLFYGSPGLGKTTLAQIVAKEMGTGFRATAGPILSKAGDLAAILSSLEEGDVLFIDEIHRLHPAVEEVLYPAMEDFHLDIMIGEGPAARSVRIDLPEFTLVGATTRLGLLANPLRDRFGIPLRLEFYKPEELLQVIIRGAGILNAKIDSDGAMEIARRSRGTPRIALRMLRRVRDVADIKNNGIISANLADEALNLLEVDAAGLDSADRRYLSHIAEFYQGGPVGIETLAAALSEQRDNLEETIEPYLMQKGLIQRTPRGRMLTRNAWEHLNINPPASVHDLQGELLS